MLYRDPFEGAQQPEVVIGTGCVDHQEVAVAVVGEHEVVQSPAVLVGEQPVTLASLLQPGDAGRDQRLEGSGGIICPLRWDEHEHVVLDDLAVRLGLSALVVADAGLGTINAAVLTAEHLKMRAIPLKGFIFNNWQAGDVMQEDNKKMVEEMTGAPVVACVAKGAEELPLAAAALAALYD